MSKINVYEFTCSSAMFSSAVRRLLISFLSRSMCAEIFTSFGLTTTFFTMYLETDVVHFHTRGCRPHNRDSVYYREGKEHSFCLLKDVLFHSCAVFKVCLSGKFAFSIFLNVFANIYPNVIVNKTRKFYLV